MATIKKLRLKSSVSHALKKIFIIILILLIGYLFYSYQISIFTKLDYTNQSSTCILFNDLKDYILTIGKNDTLNAAFSSENYREEYLEKYQDIKYFDQSNFIKNINTLLDKGYSVNDINMIFEHGNNEEVTDFAKREKVKYLEEFYSVPYAKLKNYDRYLAYSNETGEDEETTVLIVNMDLDKEDYTDYKNVTEFSIDMLVNKHRKLSDKYVPSDLVDIPTPYASTEGLQSSKIALNAFKKMYDAALKDGYGLVINSAYRSYQDQQEVCDTYKDLYGESYVTRYVAQPGFSEHQTGLSFDIGSTTSNIFIQSKEYDWMQENAYKYGFILRFPKKYASVTGFREEPWHYRYVGVKISTYMHNNSMSFEEYYAMFLDD